MAAAPAASSATRSACGRPPGWVIPWPTMRSAPPLSSTTTAPTEGFGQVRPRWRSPKREREAHEALVLRWLRAGIARRGVGRASFMAPTGVAAAPVGRFGPGSSLGKLPDDLLEVARLAEVLVDRGEADIGDVVEAFSPSMTSSPTVSLGTSPSLMLSSWRTIPLIMRSTRSGSTGRLRSATSTERCSLSRSNGTRRPGALDDDKLAQLHPLEGREAAAAIRADAAAADRGSVVRRPRILHLRIEAPAIGTAHRT